MNQNGTKMQNFSIIEDNGGTIHIIIHEPNDDSCTTCIMAFAGEWNILAEAVKDLFNGEDPSDWENAVENPQEHWDYYTVESLQNGGWKYIADSKGGWFGSETFGFAGQSLYEACQS
ncbi:MAG: hypothetical protein HQL75_00405 [Magnetococcales bacterium]|nr:hypothetical protein [Magnetococcales bacterium]